MAHKTFISYKYSESTELRDRIIKKLGNDSTYYQGEDGYSNDLTSYKADTIKEKLKDMIFDTTVMIVIVSPNMKQSDWMEWEIKYAMREQSRNGRTSHTDGVVCVVRKDPVATLLGTDEYAWAKNYDGSWNKCKLFDIINNNRDNEKSWADSPLLDKEKYNSLSHHYIDIVAESTFLNDVSVYINKAYEKSENLSTYNISKE